MNDQYCTVGHRWVKVFNTLLFSDYYYYPECDKVYEPTVRMVRRGDVGESYNDERYDKLKRYALIQQTKKKVTPDDLVKLGYIKEDS